MAFEESALEMEMESTGSDEGHVAMCTANDCLYNEASRCIADGVTINYHQTHADCSTYSKNQHILSLAADDPDVV